MAEKEVNRMEKNTTLFLEVYKVLSPQGKAQFEAKMEGELKNVDEKTKKLYMALVKAAKERLSTEEAIKRMEQAGSD